MGLTSVEVPLDGFLYSMLYVGGGRRKRRVET